MIWKENWAKLSTGRTVYAYGQIISVGPDGEPTYGYDGHLDVEDGKELTPAERREIADHMIERLNRWAEGT